MKINKLNISISVLLLCIIGLSQATTCPKTLTRDSEGYWSSTEAPGWKSHSKTDPNETVAASDFGGVVYAPDRQRLACVYRTSNHKWLALVSEEIPSASVNKEIMNDSGKKSAWEYDEKYKDYACGKPYVSNIDKCQFTLPTNTQNSGSST